MATGACGIDCDTCRLRLRGICSTCGSGTSESGRLKMATQERLLGAACPILACAVLNHIGYCLRDCSMFPCHNFSAGPYPFSRGFLDMQQRRRQERIPARAPYGGKVTVPEIYWDDLRKKKPGSLCEDSGAVFDPPDGYIFRALKENVRVNMAESCLESKQPGGWKRVEDPFLELMTLVYLLNVKQGALQGEMIGVQDLKDAHFFQGPHQLKTSSLIARYGHDPDKFKLAGQGLGGSVLEMADAAVCLTPFPKIPVYYVLWAADEEFPANLSILFDKSIERHLSADAIWGIVAWVSDALVNA